MTALILRMFAALPQLLAGGIRVQEQKVVWPFFQIGNFIEGAFLLVPNWGIKVIITIFFTILAVSPFFFSREYIFKGAEDESLWRDLRLWALAAAVTEIAVYLYF
jgi:hypothetical protein